MAHTQILGAASLVFALTSTLSAQVDAGEPAPEIEAKAAFNTSASDLSAFRGKVLMLDFFTTT